MKTITTTIFCLLLTALCAQTVNVKVYPKQTRAIGGHADLDRKKYFSLSDPGNNFENKVNPMLTGSDYFLDTLDVNFGRALGLVFSETRWGNTLREDASRPGFADLGFMQNQARIDNQGSSSGFRERFGDNLGVAFHDRRNAFPEWFSQYKTAQSGDEWLPRNLAAASELTTNLIRYKWNDFFRPAFFELVNEPHWSFVGDQHFADWHTSLADSIRAAGLATKVGGPCSSVAYYYRDSYDDLTNFTGFIDNTDAELDFYSFHVYDYMRWDAASNDFIGRVSTGLPVSGVLDALGGFMKNKYEKDLKMVISEHGGYISNGSEDDITGNLANQYFPGSGFEWEMERRSISNYIMVSSTIANTMAFLENPHLVEKSVPFILLESFNWDPRYYSSMMVAENFSNRNNFVESRLSDFFKYFADASGRRIRIHCPDPDLQHHAFIDGNIVTVLFNNLSTVDHTVDLDLFDISNIENVTLKRLGRQEDFRPAFTVETVTDLSTVTVRGRDAVSISIELEDAPKEGLLLTELPFYSKETAQEVRPRRMFNVEVDHLFDIEYAFLRIGVDRPVGTDQDMTVRLNGTRLTVPMEDAADRYEDNESYASMKIIPFDHSLLRENNEVEVSFPDSKSGGVGSVVIRAGIRGVVSSTEDQRLAVDFSIVPNPSSGMVNLVLPEEAQDLEEVLVYNILGAVIKRMDVRGNPRPFVDLSDAPAGTYFVALRKGNLSTRMHKLIRQ